MGVKSSANLVLFFYNDRSSLVYQGFFFKITLKILGKLHFLAQFHEEKITYLRMDMLKSALILLANIGSPKRCQKI